MRMAWDKKATLEADLSGRDEGEVSLILENLTDNINCKDY